MKIISSRSMSLFFAVAWALLLTACGGGGSGSSSTTTTTATTTPVVAPPTLVLTASTTSISATTPALLSATLKTGTGVPLAGVVVTFTPLGTNFGTLFPAGGTALTDTNGVATITLNAGTASGADSVTATAPVSGATITSNALGYTATGTTSAARVTLTSSSSSISLSNSATLSATVRDSSGAVVIGTLVRFTTAGTGFATFAPGATALTDSSGVARISLLAGSQFGADTVTATATVGSVAVASVPLGFTVSGATSVARLTLVTSGTTVGTGSPATLTATLADATGAGVPNTVVTFATQGAGFGVFAPASGTALTNASGVATIALNAGTKVGADTVTATALVNTTTVSSSPVGYTSTGTVVPVPAALTLTGSATAISATTPSTLSATLKNTNGVGIPGIVVSFKTTASGFGVFVPAAATALTDTNGVATIVLNAGTQSGADTVTATATVNGVTASSNAFGFTATGTTNASVVAMLNLGASLTTVASDSSSTSSVTATVVDASNAALTGVAVSFAANDGLLSAASAVTDATGKAVVTFSAGSTNPTSRTATITATASGKSSQIPIRIAGATISLATSSTSLLTGGTASIVTTIKNASGVVLPNQTVTLSPSSSAVTVTPTTGVTDGNGVIAATVTAVSPGTATITVSAVGEVRTTTVTVSGPSLAFQITAPASSATPTAATIGTPVTVTVQAPSPTTSVTFVTTLGTWTANGSSVYTTSVMGGGASASLQSSSAGVANIQVFDTTRQASLNDTRVITFTASCTTASKVTLQSTPSIVAPSSGGVASLSSLIATVSDSTGNPVGGCPVAFRIVNPTGGGETVSPAVVLSTAVSGGANALGQATTTFTAGSLPSAASGVQIRATVVQGTTSPVATGTAPSGGDATVVIGGTAGSVTIGRSSVASDAGNGTIYVLPMSILVADANGNPVANATVSLSAWPIAFNVGGNVCAANAPGTYYYNEDINENLSLDGGEDGLRRRYGTSTYDSGGTRDGQLTPVNSAAGTIPATVTTGTNGVATFNLTYTKASGFYVVDRIRARTVVQGTETLGEISFSLPVLVGDVTPTCLLSPSSPFTF